MNTPTLEFRPSDVAFRVVKLIIGTKCGATENFQRDCVYPQDYINNASFCYCNTHNSYDVRRKQMQLSRRNINQRT